MATARQHAEAWKRIVKIEDNLNWLVRKIVVGDQGVFGDWAESLQAIVGQLDALIAQIDGKDT